MMRKTFWQVSVAVMTVLCLVGAPAIAAKGRVAKATYAFDASKGGSIVISDENAVLASAETLTFETSRSDRMVEINVVDDSAGSVAAMVWQEDGSSTTFCDAIASMPITGGEPVLVRIIVDVTPAPSVGCAAPEMPTTGTVTATFTGKAKKMRGGHGHHHHHH